MRRKATGLPLVADERVLGLRRIVVETAAGPLVARVGPLGEGPGLVLIHGAAASWTTWSPLLQAASAAGRPLTGAVAVDLPGWGESPPAPQPLDAAAAASAVAVVLRHVGHRRWTAVGHSLGGFVALQLAADEPAATDGVVLVSPSGPAVVRAAQHPFAGGLRLPWFAGMRIAMRVLAALPQEGRPLLRQLRRRRILPVLAGPLFADRAAVHPSVPAALAEEVRPRAFAAAVRAAATTDPAWSRVRCPVRSVRGVRDVFVGAGDAALLQRLLPDFRQTAVADAGHFAAVERPDAVLAALDEVRRLPRRARRSV